MPLLCADDILADIITAIITAIIIDIYIEDVVTDPAIIAVADGLF